jgi:uncharacterized protein with FMN-binding domain
MRRTLAMLAATVAGLVVLLLFKTTPRSPAGQPPAAASQAPPGPGSGHRSRSVAGSAVQTMFGPVQVRVSLSGGHITAIQALQMPHDFALSQQISAYAGPLLRKEALRAQSARIDVISGATYTSEGYRQSLQAALDNTGG